MSNFRTYKENFDAVYNYPNRTPYDQLMNLVYDPNNEKLHPAPWPMERTNFDLNLQKKWCISDCGFEDENVPTMVPGQPTMIPTMIPIQPTMTPEYPTMTPSYPTMTPEYPTMSPSYPTMAPEYPTMTPGYPTMTPGYPQTNF